MTSWRKPTGQIQPHMNLPSNAPTTNMIPMGNHGKIACDKRSVVASKVEPIAPCALTLATTGSMTHDLAPLKEGFRRARAMPANNRKKPSWTRVLTGQ
jgi:hypothetical protein